MLLLVILGNHDNKKSKFVGFLFKIKFSIEMKKESILWVIFRHGRKKNLICDEKKLKQNIDYELVPYHT
jgi:hypothetical protein